MSAANPFPSYLEMRRRVPVAAWGAARALVLGVTAGVIALLFVRPHDGLVLWWLGVLPLLPLVFMLAPGLWRNLCPMATLNQVPRLLGVTRGLTAPAWLLRNAIAVQGLFYFALITTRVPYLDHNGAATAVLLLVALTAALAGGLVFKGKSGWCGTLCPLMPIQRLYGQTPAVVVANSHCRTCVGCTPNCIDFNPRLAVVADVHESGEERVNQLRVFAGVFPGFVLAFLIVPGSVVGQPANLAVSVGEYYLLTAVYMLASLGLYFLLEAFLPLTRLVVMALFGAAALNIHNLLGFTSAFHVAKPMWLRAAEGAVVLAVTTAFVVRTFLHERRVAVLEQDERTVVTHVDHEPLPGDAPEVSFAPDGPRLVVEPGTTVLEAAERGGISLEAGCRMGVCGADPVLVVSGAGHLSPPRAAERSTLERLGLGEGCRMACSARVRGPVEVTLEITRSADAVPTSARAPDPAIAHVVVVGNGIAANTAADHVRRLHPSCTIDVVGEESHTLYNRMGISRLVYGRSAMSGLVLNDDEWYERNRIGVWLNTIVDEIDRDAREVVLATGERLPYDRLIIATGARAALPPIAGLDDPSVFVMRTAEDAARIRAVAQRSHARRAAVIGGGLLGLEAAHALHRIGLRVTVLQRSERLLPGQLDERAAELLSTYFDRLGIAVVLGARPAAVVRGDTGTAVALADAEAVPADLVVVCAGITPSVELAARAGLAVERGILVDDAMRTSDDTVFAAGDVVQHAGGMTGLWPSAVAQAEVAAANAVGETRTYRPAPPVTVLKGVGLTVMAAGDVEGDGADVVVHEATADDLRYWKLVVRDGVAVGTVVVGEWPESSLLLDAVVAGRDVSAFRRELEAGELTALGRDEAA